MAASAPERDGCPSTQEGGRAVVCARVLRNVGNSRDGLLWTTCSSVHGLVGLLGAGIIWPGRAGGWSSLPPADRWDCRERGKRLDRACFFVATQVYFGQFQGCLPPGAGSGCVCVRPLSKVHIDYTASGRGETSSKKKERDKPRKPRRWQ
jgi:hypothetical protein